MIIDSSLVTLFALLNVVFGVVACFFGYRVFRQYLTLIGFLFGATLGLALTQNNPETIIKVIAALGLGILFGLIFFWLWRIAVLLAGLLLGAVVGFMISTQLLRLDQTTTTIIIIVLAVIGALLSFAAAKIIIKLSTAVTGSALMVIGGLVLLGLTSGNTTRVYTVDNLATMTQTNTSGIVILIIWIVLATFGFFVQSRQR